MRISDWSSDVCSSDLPSMPQRNTDRRRNFWLFPASYQYPRPSEPPMSLRDALRIPSSAITDESIYRQRRQRSEEKTSELQSLMRISYAVLCVKKNIQNNMTTRKHVI